jgi:hypothetical protein
MKVSSFVFLVVLLVFSACQEKQEDTQPISDLTGNEVTYNLFPGTDFNHTGTITFSEMNDGSTRISIKLSGPMVNDAYPVHLHYGPFVDDAKIAAVLSPVLSNEGTSSTELSWLADLTEISYEDLLSFDGHIKIHFDDQDNKDITLAYAGIGKNPNTVIEGSITTCKSSFKE